MRVLGVDPAAGKPSVWFDGSDFGRGRVPKLRAVLEKEGPVLVCWDAPLTGPEDPDSENPTSLTQRRIESAFASVVGGVPGVSVLPYCGLSHWTISQTLLGLPRVGPYNCATGLPFRLVFEPPEPSERAIVEVHPTLALWWLLPEEQWRQYKGLTSSDELPRRARMEASVQHMGAYLIEQFKLLEDAPLPTDDDQLDAMVAWLLGSMWMAGSDDIEMVGDRQAGGFLMHQSARPFPLCLDA